MNTLKLKLNPYKDINIASLDDKPLSPYSELNNYMKEPFLSWVSKLLEAAEREINDDYCLEVVSESFEALFLEGMQNDFDSCKEYRTASFQVNTSTSESQDGVITALKDGVATITATTTKASSSISVKVLPNIRNIVSTVTQSHLYVGQTESISVLVEPNNCFDSSYEWKSSDKSVAIVDKLDDGQTVIRATGIGNCTLTCIAKEGGCSTTCNVLVESTFKKRENAHGMLSLTAILAVACIFCAALSPVLCVPVAIATVVCGVLAIARNKGDRFWAFILMAAAVLTALEATGITNWL